MIVFIMIINKSSLLSNNSLEGALKSNQSVQERLFLLYHSQKCQNADGQCPITKICSDMKRLWLHINKKCKDNSCGFPHCCSSRAILNHYRKCTDSECRVCGPVRKAILLKDNPSLSTEEVSSGGNQKQKINNEKRKKSLPLHLKLLEHASSCVSKNVPPLILKLCKNEGILISQSNVRGEIPRRLQIMRSHLDSTKLSF